MPPHLGGAGWREDKVACLRTLEGPSFADDPRRPVGAAITCLGNNRSRMDYPAYRREGLPITSCAVESLIKQFN